MRATTGLPNASLEGRYIRVRLARPVPQDGEARIRIIKTYKDPKSYRREGETIVFDRPLGIRRNAVILPPGYQLVSCNVPSQVLEEADGRIGISFMNMSPAQAPLVVRARPHGHGRRRRRRPGPLVPLMPPARVLRPPADAPPADVSARPCPRVGAGVPGSRDRLLPAGTVDARVQPVSRLHGDA